MTKSSTQAPIALAICGLMTVLVTSVSGQTAESGPPSKISVYPDEAGVQSPFAAKVFKGGTGGLATADGTFFPGAFVGWDPKSGDPITLVGSEFRIGSKVLATVPDGYVVVNGSQKWCNILCYRTGLISDQLGQLSSDWTRGTLAETNKVAVVTESGAIRALLFSSKRVLSVKGSIKRSDLKPIGYAILEGKKLIPLPVKGDLAASSYSLDTLFFRNYVAGGGQTGTLIKNHKVVFSEKGYVSGFILSSKGLLSMKSNPPTLTLGNVSLEGQEQRALSISDYVSLPIIQTGNFFDAFLPNGSVVRKQTSSAPSAVGRAYGPLLSVDVPVFTGDKQNFTVALGDQILRGKQSDIPNNGTPDFITAMLDGNITCWFFKGNQMLRFDGTGDTVTKQYSRVADVNPEILGVSPSRLYAVVGQLNKQVSAYVLFIIELKSGRTQALTLRNSSGHSVVFAADDEICIRFSQDGREKLYRASILSLMSNAK